MNAYFYAAWMVANFAVVGLVALTTILYAVGAADPATLMYKIRTTLKLSAMVGLLANEVLLIGANEVLGMFNAACAEQAGWALRLLGLGVFPILLRSHYIALCRIHGRVTRVAAWMDGRV
jgi:Na+-driven multidrug efflux pump